MAGGSPPTQSPPPAKLPTESNPTYIDCIDKDILREILLRLPSLAALVRAACTCRAWRSAVASSPAFRRRFRDLHRPPLLGMFFEVPSPAQSPNLPAFPAFFPKRGRDRDLVAAVRGGDFFLTSIQERPDDSPCWDIIDSRNGHVLLMNWDEALLTVFNPLLWRSKTFDLGSEDLFDGREGTYAQLNARLLCSDENPMSFRVVLLGHDRSRVRPEVFSSETSEWSLLPWVEVPERTSDEEFWLDDCGMQANGFLYWVYKNRESLITLDTTTMEFSVDELPPCLRYLPCSFVLGETKDSMPCIVYAKDFSIGMLLREKTGFDGIESWHLDEEFDSYPQLIQVLGELPEEVNVVAVIDGFAYLATEMHHDPQNSRWLLSLCLETMELEKLFRVAFDGGVHPYVMGWPPALVGNYGTFALGDAP